MRTRGAPPFELRLGTARLVVNFGDTEGGCVDLDGAESNAENGTVELKGIAPGAHRFVVGADDYIPRAYGVRLGDHEVRVVRPKLTRR